MILLRHAIRTVHAVQMTLHEHHIVRRLSVRPKDFNRT